MGLIITPEIEAKLKDSFVKELIDPVKLIVFTQELECRYCRENRTLAEEIAALSPIISLETYNFVTDKAKVIEYKIEMVPAIAVIGKKDYGIRFYGIPGGYEFTSLLETIKMISTNDSELPAEVKSDLAKITKPVNIKVFVTLTCPYCPPAVINAHRLAFENDNIVSNMIESSEFVPLGIRYKIYAVPKTVINEKIELEGALPVESLLAEIQKV
jgi:glutaredoxin-like protein